MRDLLTTQLRVLTFRISREELLKLNRRHLAWGLAWTWIVGIGRWWDDPGARLLQHLGLGSVIYIFVLSLKQSRPLFDDRDFTSETSEYLAEFQTHIATADNDQTLGYEIDVHHRAVR